MTRSFFILLLGFLLVACVSDVPLISGCDPVGNIKPVCNMQSPEDIAALDDDRHLLLAHFGGMIDGTGSLSLFDTQTEQVTSLFPDGPGERGVDLWGDPDCTDMPGAEFSPHGTHLHQLSDGRWRYLVVNHGGRETVEIFELDNAGAQSRLDWRGCIRAAPETFMNDVVGLTNGDIIFSRMLHHGGNWEMVKSLVGIPTGDLWRWNHEKGLWILPGTDAAQPNGLEISEDNRYVYANMYMEKEVWKVDVDTGEVVAVGKVSNADNSAWGSDGRLWIATHPSTMELMSCFGSQESPCGAGFEIVALDPETMVTESLFSHRGPPMGAATVAVPQAGRVYMGSFVGDRMISVPDFTGVQ